MPLSAIVSVLAGIWLGLGAIGISGQVRLLSGAERLPEIFGRSF